MTAPFKLKAPLPTEDDEATALIQWAKWQKWKGKRLSDLLIMIPNGAYLGGDAKQRAITMAKLKRQGFRNGVSDYFLAACRPPFGGLFLELKRTKLGIVTTEQKDFHQLMTDLGYSTAVAEGWERARQEIETYLGMVK